MGWSGPRAADDGRSDELRDDNLRSRMLLGGGVRVPPGARRGGRARRLQRGVHPRPDLPGGVLPHHRPRRGRAGHVRSGPGDVRPAAGGLLGHARPHAGRPAGPGHRRPVPELHLHPHAVLPRGPHPGPGAAGADTRARVSLVRRPALALALALAFLGLGAPAAGARAQPVNGRIAFLLAGGDTGDIDRMNPDGSCVRPLLAGPGDQESAAWSPNGRRLVFGVAGISLGLADADGTHKTVLTQRPGFVYWPSWSPHGNRIVYAGKPGQYQHKTQLYVIHPDRSGFRKLTDDPHGAFTPAWSPDGRWIAYGGRGISLVRPGGSLNRSLTHHRRDVSPSWSPDGRRLAFTRIFEGGVRTDVFVVDRDGSGLTRLTRDGKSSWPVWSPDGSLIAFGRFSNGGGNGVFTMRPDGSGVTRLTSGPAGREVPLSCRALRPPTPSCRKPP